MLKKLVFWASLAYTLALTAVCLIKINKVVPVQITFGDKIFHCLAYIVFTLLWYFTFIYKFNLEHKKALWYATIGSIIFGIVIEVLQSTLTVYRAAEIYDIIANTVGVFLATIFIALKNNRQIKKQ